MMQVGMEREPRHRIGLPYVQVRQRVDVRVTKMQFPDARKLISGLLNPIRGGKEGHVRAITTSNCLHGYR